MMKWIVFSLTILATSTFSVAQSVLTPMDVANIKTVSSALLSDDSGTVIYTLRVYPYPTEENAPATIQMHLLDVDRVESRPFLTRSSASQVAFRPGHNSVTFLARLGQDK